MKESEDMKKSKKSLLLVLVLALSVIFSACSGNADTSQKGEGGSGFYPLSFTDSLGTEITIEKEPERIVSLAPNITEMVYALGLSDKLVGRTDYCIYPEEVNKVQSIGDLMNPNIEKIMELEPDVIISSSLLTEEYQNKFKELKIQVINIADTDSFEGVYNSIKSMGKLFNVEEKAAEVINSIKDKVAEVEGKVASKSKPSVYYVVGFGQGGDYTATGETFVNDIITYAGGDNIAKDVTGWTFSKEMLIEKDPEIILLPSYYYDEFISTEGYKDLTAVKNKKVYVVDNNVIDVQGPRIGEGVEAVAKALHPELFK